MNTQPDRFVFFDFCVARAVVEVLSRFILSELRMVVGIIVVAIRPAFAIEHD